MVIEITNLHILKYLPTCRLHLHEHYSIDYQRYAHTESKNIIVTKTILSEFFLTQDTKLPPSIANLSKMKR